MRKGIRFFSALILLFVAGHALGADSPCGHLWTLTPKLCTVPETLLAG